MASSGVEAAGQKLQETVGGPRGRAQAMASLAPEPMAAPDAAAGRGGGRPSGRQELLVPSIQIGIEEGATGARGSGR